MFSFQTMASILFIHILPIMIKFNLQVHLHAVLVRSPVGPIVEDPIADFALVSIIVVVVVVVGHPLQQYQ